MYNDTTWKSPDPKFVIGQYLVPDIGVGSAMTNKIPWNTSKVVQQSTIQPLTLEDMENPELK